MIVKALWVWDGGERDEAGNDEGEGGDEDGEADLGVTGHQRPASAENQKESEAKHYD